MLERAGSVLDAELPWHSHTQLGRKDVNLNSSALWADLTPAKRCTWEC